MRVGSRTFCQVFLRLKVQCGRNLYLAAGLDLERPKKTNTPYEQQHPDLETSKCKPLCSKIATVWMEVHLKKGS